MVDRFRNPLNQNKGLTLVEVLLVIVIIAIIYAVFSSRIGNPTDKARLVGVKNDFRNFELALNTYEKWFSELPKPYSTSTTYTAAGVANTDYANLSSHSKLNLVNAIDRDAAQNITDANNGNKLVSAETLKMGYEDEEFGATGATTIPTVIYNKVDPWDRFYRYYYYKPVDSAEATASGFIEGVVIVSPGPNKKEDFTSVITDGGSVESMISHASGKDVLGIDGTAGPAVGATIPHKNNTVQATAGGQDDVFLVLWLDLEGSLKMKTYGLDKDVN